MELDLDQISLDEKQRERFGVIQLHVLIMK
jgi:hypothetical protein